MAKKGGTIHLTALKKVSRNISKRVKVYGWKELSGISVKELQLTLNIFNINLQLRFTIQTI